MLLFPFSVVKVTNYINHPDYNLFAKKEMGIKEYYEFDVALIQLEKAVEISSNLRYAAQIFNMWC